MKKEDKNWLNFNGFKENDGEYISADGCVRVIIECNGNWYADTVKEQHRFAVSNFESAKEAVEALKHYVKEFKDEVE